MNKKKSQKELYKDIFTKNLGQRLDEMSNSERKVYWGFVISGIIIMILIVVFFRMRMTFHIFNISCFFE
ncbi:hypothetical protein O0882_01975 [Janthinobacterium sp. SUN073]|uniref:hypothetical protein n=1 Tax=Janthinobacterium sp. SUN073 TaxID=3004102 RepID=UPI0025AF2B75|nr:hypothetical protein [Janthinobacterium sp. SUN073]MDN2695076.1 hypothetical protein [Janthinobacterium sp. SUN073]